MEQSRHQDTLIGGWDAMTLDIELVREALTNSALNLNEAAERLDGDPEEALRRVADAIAHGTVATDGLVQHLRAQGWTYAAIGDALHVSGEAVRQRLSKLGKQ